MRVIKPFFIVLAVITLGAHAAFGQSEPGSAVSFIGGAASGASDTGAALGGSWLVVLHERVSIEGQGTYLGRGEGADAVTAGGSVLVNLLPASEGVVPYVAIGGAVYHASYDLANPRFLGPVGTQFAAGSSVCPAPGSGFGLGPGPGFGSGRGICPASVGGYWGVGALPTFYARRLGPLAFPRGGIWEMRSFTDPALSVGGGFRFNVTDRVMLRPDVRALVILADGDTHTIATFGVHLGYRF